MMIIQKGRDSHVSDNGNNDDNSEYEVTAIEHHRILDGLVWVLIQESSRYRCNIK